MHRARVFFSKRVLGFGVWHRRSFNGSLDIFLSDFSSQHNSVDEQEKADLDFGEPLLFKAQNYSTCPDINRKGARNVRLTSFFLDNFLRLFKQVFPSAGGFAAHAATAPGAAAGSCRAVASCRSCRGLLLHIPLLPLVV